MRPRPRTATVPAATLRDPANDVRAGDIDLRSISIGKRNGALVVRFTVRRPITDNVSYTASVKAGAGSWALVARRSAGVDSFLLYNLATGTTTTVSGAIEGRTATVRAPIESLGGPTNETLGRVQAYFRAEPVGGRSGDATVPLRPDRRSGSVSPIVARGRSGARASGPARFAEPLTKAARPYSQPRYGSGPRFSSPRAMISRWISLVPSQIRSTRSSR